MRSIASETAAHSILLSQVENHVFLKSIINIKGNTFVVSGGASGLGEAVVRHFAEKGGKLIILDVNEKAGISLVEEYPGRIYFPGRVDVTQKIDVETALRNAPNEFHALSGAVLCAGIATLGLTAALPEHTSPYGLQDLDKFRRMLEINVVGSFNVAQQVAQRMIEQGQESTDGSEERGGIVLTSSSVSTDGQSGSAGYSSSKGAISSIVLPMARDLAQYRIRVNAIAPGVFLTPINDAFIKQTSHCGEFPVRPGRPEEFARFVEHVFVNEMINGAVLRQDAALRGVISID